MALGGGRFFTMNKILPGTYINVITKTVKNYGIETGIVALPICLNWGPQLEVMELPIDDWIGKSFEKLGYENDAAALLPIREVFTGGAIRVILFNLNNGAKATCEFADAKYAGIRGNDIKIKIQVNVDDENKFDVTTIVDNIDRDIQTVAAASDLVDNDWVNFKKDVTLSVTSGIALDGGTNGTITGNEHNKALQALEQKYFNNLVCDSNDATTVGLYVSYVKRLRESMGKDFQLVCFNTAADYEGVINVCTEVEEEGGLLVYWVAGKSCSRDFGKSNTNQIYNGEYTPICKQTQTQIEEAVENGQFIFHAVGDDIRVVLDYNSLVTFTDEKNENMRMNEVIRVTDYLNNAIANLFNMKYIGNVINNDTGRAHLRQDIAAIQDELVQKGAISYNGDELTVGPGPKKGDVVIADLITVNAAMIRLYMTITVQ